MKTILIGACSDLGVSLDGSSLGPKVLTENVTYSPVTLLYPNKVIKNKDRSNRRKNMLEINNFNQKLFDEVSMALNHDYFPITIGGDHSIAISSSLASAKKYQNIGIIWFDAHPDYHTLESTITGNIHGLPLATITGFHNEELRSFQKEITINPKNAVIIGARSIDVGEKENLEEAGITVFTTEDLKKEGIEKIVAKALSIAENNTKGIHISYDLDAIDPIDAPGVSVPENDGIKKEDAILINKLFLEHISNIVSYDLVEFNPLKDIDNKTLKIAEYLLQEIDMKAKEKDYNE